MSNIMRTSNPALNAETFASFNAIASSRTMTLEGTATKAAILLALVAFSATYTWNLVQGAAPQQVVPWIVGGSIAGLVMGMITIFKKEWAAGTAPLYALAEGLLLGAISSYYERQFHGLVFQAVTLTFGTLAMMLFAYGTGIIRATAKFKMGVFAATGGIFMLYLVNMVMGFFGSGMPFLYSNGLLGIGVSVVIVIVAALNLILDFDFIETGVQRGAPKYMEWYGAFSLMVTLIWLYLEMLRLLSKMRSRN